MQKLRFILPVIARDRGQPSLFNQIILNISLEDVNDNAPQFQQKEYDLWIAENSPVGSIIGTLIAKDPDIGANALIKFKIFGGSDAKFFEIEEDSEQPGLVRILSRVEFDFESNTNKYFVELQASRLIF